MASETSAIALRSEEIRKEMPVATASVGGVANLSHDLFFILLYFIKKNCMQRNRFYNGIVSEIKLFSYVIGNLFLIYMFKIETLYVGIQNRVIFKNYVSSLRSCHTFIF